MEPEKGKQVDVLKAGKSAAVKIDAVTSIQYGRQFDHTYPLYARVTRRSVEPPRGPVRTRAEKTQNVLAEQQWRG